jgi:hypothetical protein
VVSPFPGFSFDLLAGSVKAFRLTKRAPDEWDSARFLELVRAKDLIPFR